jgi:hypothetical protein
MKGRENFYSPSNNRQKHRTAAAFGYSVSRGHENNLDSDHVALVQTSGH